MTYLRNTFYLNGDIILQLIRDFLMHNFQDSLQFLEFTKRNFWMFVHRRTGWGAAAPSPPPPGSKIVGISRAKRSWFGQQHLEEN